jgi:hypothetical protein
MARHGDRLFSARAGWLLVFLLLSQVGPAAAGGLDRSTWLLLYESPATLARSRAVAYVDGMANGLTVAEAIDCSGVELSGEQIAAAVAVLLRDGRLELQAAVPLSLLALRCRPTPSGIFDRSRR